MPSDVDPGPSLQRHATVAVMQPYFYPYAGYYRLFVEAATFVILDSVQFPRRGRVHRSNILGPAGVPEWLTLPLRRQPMEIAIKDLAFAADARAEFDRRLARLPGLRRAAGPAAGLVREHLFGPLDDPVEFLIRGFALMTDLLGLGVRLIRSSSLPIDPALRGQDRIIAIVQAVGASHYVNASGGRGLYDRDAFERNGLTPDFLAPYDGPMLHMINALFTTDTATLRQEIGAVAV